MSPTNEQNADKHVYSMKIERTIVDKLGLQMYDKASAVVSELIANSYDADAEEVIVKLPLGKALATHKDGKLDQKEYYVEVEDDGHGMTPEEADDFYLKVGPDRRKNPKQGPKSREKDRPVMGRKGIGKLAPFGICRTIEVRSAGGKKTKQGYKVTHFELDYDKIVDETSEGSDEYYHPRPLSDDCTWDKKSGTRIILRNFNAKRVPDKKTFHRQLAAKFGLELPDFKIVVHDIKKEDTEPNFKVGHLDIPLMPGTEIELNNRPVVTEEGEEYPIRGWVGMARQSYKHEEMAGIRIYARGKMASITRDFGIPSGFKGEYVARSYLVGEIHAEWLDEDEDLIQTPRQDILWSSDLGQAFTTWGQALLKEVANRGRQPRRDNVKAKFMQVSELAKKAEARFPDPELRIAVIKIGEKIGEFASEEELTDEDYVEDLAELILTIAPHKLLVDTFKKISEIAIDGKVDLAELFKLFETSEIAQLASYGQIVSEKLKTIDIFEKAIKQENINELELQNILERAPWLINPRWELAVANRSLKTFQEAFGAWYKKKYGEEIITTTRIKHQTKRPDFIFLKKEDSLILVEIKPPKHVFNEEDWERLQRYYDAMEKFLKENPAFKKPFPEDNRVILIRDSERLTNPTVQKAYESLVEKKRIEPYTWAELLKNTKEDHEDFLIVKDKFDTD